MSQTQDDVQQMVAAAHFLRDQPNAEAHYYSRVIAEVAQRMLAAPVAAQEPAWTPEQVAQVHREADAMRAKFRPGRVADAPAADGAQGERQPEPNWKAFALAVLKDSRENLGCDVDGAMVQEKATAHSLLVDVLVTESCGDYCNCAEFGFPTSCYRYSPAVLKAFAADK